MSRRRARENVPPKSTSVCFREKPDLWSCSFVLIDVYRHRKRDTGSDSRLLSSVLEVSPEAVYHMFLEEMNWWCPFNPPAAATLYWWIIGHEKTL